ncbi:hypothetical protein OUZ56_016490 [Daphnia magna]|uniref:Uncharacterized protein n=1 Tax=Daphnia magna TaxID=35525 RepID=A0ABR0AQP4_9CRUS|nr:hypothetical protein OUZ56_016490 [Daphnia magna]
MKYYDIPFVEELIFDLHNLKRVLHGEESSNEEDVYFRERRNEAIHRMAPFNANRNGIFHINNDEQIFRDQLERQLRGIRYIPPLSHVLVALQFYANGTFENAVGNILKIS